MGVMGWKREKHTRNAHEPMNVDKAEAYSKADELSEPNPTAGQTVKPKPPMKFQNPTCQPRVFRRGLYLYIHTLHVSSRMSIYQGGGGSGSIRRTTSPEPQP